MLRLGREQEVVRVMADQYGYPTYAADIADGILATESQFRDRRKITWGTYHYCGKGTTTWHRFAGLMFDVAKNYHSLAVKRVEPIASAEYPTLAKRPTNSVLDCSLMRRTLGSIPSPGQKSLPLC